MTTHSRDEPRTVVDCRGLRCPMPVAELARRVPEVALGEVLRVLVDDPAAPGDIAAWCRLRGQEFLGHGSHEDSVAVEVRRVA